MPAQVTIHSAPSYFVAAYQPANLTLASVELGDPEYASLVLDCSSVTDATKFSVNGYVFTAKAVAVTELGYGEFQSQSPIDSITSRSLQLAMLDSPLADDYYITEAGQSDGTVTLTAKFDGPAYNVAYELLGGSMGATPMPVNPSYQSQVVSQKSWGVYFDVYIDEANRSYSESGHSVNDYTLTKAGRFELPYNGRENRYTLDLAPILRAYVGPQKSNTFGYWQPERMAAFAVRVGAMWATATNAYRNAEESYRFPAGGYATSSYAGGGIAWAIASTGYIANGAGCFLHENLQLGRPLMCWYDEDYAAVIYKPTFSMLVNANQDAYWNARYQLSNGSEQAEGLASYDPGVDKGGAYDLQAWTMTSDTLLPLTVDEVQLDAIDPYSPDETSVLKTLRFVNTAGPYDQWLGWVSRCGGFEHWNFLNTPDEAQKRTLNTFVPADGTTQMARVDLTQTQRFYSRPLNKAQWDFLVQDLQTSPSVWRIHQGFPIQQVLVSDFDAKMDPETRLYTLSIEVTPAAPFVPLSQ